MIFSLKSNRVPLIRFIGEISYKEPWKHFTRKADEYIIYIIKKGILYIEEDGIQYTLKKNDFFLFEPGRIHSGYKASVCDYVYIHFTYDELKPLHIENEKDFCDELQIRRYQAFTSNCLLNSYPNDSTCYIEKHYNLSNYNYYLVLLRETIDNYGIHHENYKELVSCELLIMLINISRDITTSRIESQKGNDKPFTIARDILNFLNAEYPNKLSSTNISDKFEGNFDYLNRCFKRLTGHTIFSYLNLIRINKAKEMIMATHMHFNEISYLVGIDNPYYFSRLFKKIVGKTPSQYSSTYNEASH